MEAARSICGAKNDADTQVSPKEALERCAQDWEDITAQLGKEEQLRYFQEDVGYKK